MKELEFESIEEIIIWFKDYKKDMHEEERQAIEFLIKKVSIFDTVDLISHT